MKIVNITQEDINKLPQEILSNPELMALVHTIITSTTKLEEMVGYDLVLIADKQPKTEDIIKPEETYKEVDGNKGIDGGAEIVGFMGSTNYRFLANDSKGHGYFMCGVVQAQKAFSFKHLEDGRWTLTGKDFVSAKSGLKYKFLGFRCKRSNSNLISTNPLTVSNAEMGEVLRAYWQTIA